MLIPSMLIFNVPIWIETAVSAVPKLCPSSKVPVCPSRFSRRGPNPNLIGNQQNRSSQEILLVRPRQNISASVPNIASSIATQGISGVVAAGGACPGTFGILSDGSTDKLSGATAVTSSQIAARGISSSSSQEGLGLAMSGSDAALPPRPYIALAPGL